MPKRVVGLSAVSVRHLPPGRYADGLNLYLDVQSPAARYWVFRYTLAGRAREKGLGPASGRAAVSLAEVRRKVRPLYDMVRDGRDPLAERDAARAAAKNAEAKGKTFSDVATLYVAAHEVGWKSARHHHQWTRSLRDYVLPRIGDLPVDEISVAHVMAVLEPIWHDVPETASRVRGRIESVLDYAKARGWRHGENCARWRGHLDSLLPSRARLAAVEHHPALPWHEIAEFMADLRNQGGGVPVLALEFTILTGARTTETLGATWTEVDRQTAVWTVPGSRMKSGKEHRVPLPDAAMTVLDAVAPLRETTAAGLIFPGSWRNRPLSHMAMPGVLQRMSRQDVTVHGFRSCFRDWAAETGRPADIAEAALAHALGSRVQSAYQRGDLLERRRKLMSDWADWCSRPALSAEVTRLRA